MPRILGREGADARVPGYIFDTVVQVVLLFGYEMSVLTPRMGRTLVVFQYRMALHITENNCGG